MEDLIKLPLYVLYSQLSDDIICILKESHVLANTIRNVEQRAEYWKEKAENIVGLYLPFAPKQGYEMQYWKKMYTKLSAIVNAAPDEESDEESDDASDDTPSDDTHEESDNTSSDESDDASEESDMLSCESDDLQTTEPVNTVTEIVPTETLCTPSISYNRLTKYGKTSAFNQLFTSGRYEYIWIALTLDDAFSPPLMLSQAAFGKIVTRGDMDALLLLVGHMRLIHKSVPWKHVIKVAISSGSVEMLYTLLDMYKPHASTDGVVSFVQKIAIVANIQYLDKVIEMFSNILSVRDVVSIAYMFHILQRDNDDDSHDSDSHEDESDSNSGRAKFLAYILSLSDQQYHRIYSYGNVRHLSPEEAVVLASSNIVKLNQISMASPEVAIILYDSPYASVEFKNSLLYFICEDDVVFAEFLESRRIVVPLDKLDMYARMNNRSLEVAIGGRRVAPDVLEELMNISIEWNHPIPLECTYKLLGSDVRLLERRIMIAGNNTDYDKTLPLFIRLGVSLKVVGERIAFSPCADNISAINQLHEAGYNFEPIMHDFVIQRLFDGYYVRKLVDVLSIPPSVFKAHERRLVFESKVYADYTEGPATRIFMKAIRKHNIEAASKAAQNSELESYINNYSWVSELTPDMFKGEDVHQALLQIARNLEKQILRRVVSTLDGLIVWLRIVTGLGKDATLYFQDDDYGDNLDSDITIGYGDHVVSFIRRDITTSIYGGLDLFSSTGVPLTEPEDIRARQLKLISE